MKKIIILGSSAAAPKIVETLRQGGEEFDLSLICFDEHLPFNRDAFVQAAAKEISLNKVFAQSKDFYQQQRVNVLPAKNITRINLKRKKIFTEEKETFDFDILIIGELPQTKLPEIKGNHKAGIYTTHKFHDFDQVLKALPIIDTVVIQSSDFYGFELALACLKRGKEVILISSDETFLSRYIPPAAAEWIIKQWESKGLKIITSSGIAEFLGDADVKAVRLKSGKVIGTQLVICEGAQYDHRIFSEESLLKIDQRIIVTPEGQTNLDYIFACDRAAQLEGQAPDDDFATRAYLEEIGVRIAARIKGETRATQEPIRTRTINQTDLTVSLIGPWGQSDHVAEKIKTEDSTLKAVRIFWQGECLTGSVAVNNAKAAEKILTLIQNKTPVEKVEDLLYDQENTVELANS